MNKGSFGEPPETQAPHCGGSGGRRNGDTALQFVKPGSFGMVGGQYPHGTTLLKVY